MAKRVLRDRSRTDVSSRRKCVHTSNRQLHVLQAYPLRRLIPGECELIPAAEGGVEATFRFNRRCVTGHVLCSMLMSAAAGATDGAMAGSHQSTLVDSSM